MTKRPATKTPCQPKRSEDEGLSYAQSSIQVMERVLAAVSDYPETQGAYDALLVTYMETLQEELAPYAFDLAYALFSRDRVAAERRREWDRE